jgi:hypothetical protein
MSTKNKHTIVQRCSKHEKITVNILDTVIKRHLQIIIRNPSASGEVTSFYL